MLVAMLAEDEGVSHYEFIVGLWMIRKFANVKRFFADRLHVVPPESLIDVVADNPIEAFEMRVAAMKESSKGNE